jgi:hypothetical protein
MDRGEKWPQPCLEIVDCSSLIGSQRTPIKNMFQGQFEMADGYAACWYLLPFEKYLIVIALVRLGQRTSVAYGLL